MAKGTDLDTLFEVGSYFSVAFFMYVFPAHAGSNDTAKRTLQLQTRTNYAASGGMELWYRKHVDDTWTDWVKIVTATPPHGAVEYMAFGIVLGGKAYVRIPIILGSNPTVSVTNYGYVVANGGSYAVTNVLSGGIYPGSLQLILSFSADATPPNNYPVVYRGNSLSLS